MNLQPFIVRATYLVSPGSEAGQISQAALVAPTPTMEENIEAIGHLAAAISSDASSLAVTREDWPLVQPWMQGRTVFTVLGSSSGHAMPFPGTRGLDYGIYKQILAGEQSDIPESIGLPGTSAESDEPHAPTGDALHDAMHPELLRQLVHRPRPAGSRKPRQVTRIVKPADHLGEGADMVDTPVDQAVGSLMLERPDGGGEDEHD